MKRFGHILCLAVCLLSLAPTVVRAQFNFDVLSVEALIDDHKRIRTVLLARSGVEQANKLLHEYSEAVNVGYDSLNVQLDKYRKCFDVIDFIYNSGMTVVRVRNTYSDVSDRISQLTSLTEKFVEEYTLKGNILSSDTIIINAYRNAVEEITEDGSQLINSLVELAQYATGLRDITTEGLLTVIGSINDCLDKIRDSVDHTYFVVYRYITMRMTYFKRALFRAKTVREMCHDAFERWKYVTERVGY